MPTIHVIEPILTTRAGPEVDFGGQGQDQDFVPIHHRQGTLDGACGLYSMFMSLLVHRMATVDELGLLHRANPRTRLGKLTKSVSLLSPLVQDGTYLQDLHTMLDDAYGRVLGTELSEKRGAKLIPFIAEQVLMDRPVILSVAWNGGAHAVLVVALEYAANDREHRPSRLLALDPSLESPRVAAWNVAINAFASQTGPYPYVYLSRTEGNQLVQLTGALSTWRK